MAKLVTQNADMFVTDADSSVTVMIPHAFGRLVRRLVQNHVNEKVLLIKYAREAFPDSNGSTMGLKDAKDVLDHYFDTADSQG